MINSSKTKQFVSRNFELQSDISKKSQNNNTCLRHNNKIKSRIDLISLRRAIIGEEKKSNSKGEMNYKTCKK